MTVAVAAPRSIVRQLGWRLGPLDLLAQWPETEPLAALVSGGTPAGPRNRWSIFARPVGSTRLSPHDASADPLALIRTAAPASRIPEDLPFVGGWIASLSYDLGRRLEPCASARAGEPAAQLWSDWPDLEMQHCPGAYVHDARSGAWFVVGNADRLPQFSPDASAGPPSGVTCVDPPRSLTGRPRFESDVRRAVELIRAGDIFQANLSHHLHAQIAGSPRALAARLLASSGAWFGAYLELGDGRSVVSASPELFVEFDPRSRRVVTRPIKGTRPAAAHDARRQLKESTKDRAELAMIVDLMRNDLGRVCAFGSMAVDDPRAIELHGRSSVDPPAPHPQDAAGVYHGVATVSGVLRPDRDIADLLRASFPPGSVTGAPKIRAMQVIDMLEPRRRAAYCGAIGYISDCGRSAWNVAIRTAMLRRAASGDANLFDLVFPVGAGIVADSDPASEWLETLHKAGVLAHALGREVAG
ncbi:MAG: anthranilate synthase component I family protein [Planctomycetota bacterium]|nr:anthranilate synthase component I family protein [Planctomycetota bacterium]